MKKQIILVAVFSIVLFGFGSLNNAVAKVNQPIDITSLGDEVGMVSSDLGVDNVGTLPTSRLYFFKEWSRGIQRLFTFDSVAKAELELNITNEKAAEMLEVDKTKPDDVGALKNALENYTNAQERLNARLAKLTETSGNPKIADLFKKVDEASAKYLTVITTVTVSDGATVLGTVVSDGATLELDGDLILKAEDNILKTFTITVMSVNDAPASLKQKAEEQIKRAGVAISEANSTMKYVATTQGVSWDPTPGAVSYLTVPKQTQGTTFGEKTRASGSISGKEMMDAIIVAKAKGNLERAKKAFAEGKYGEAYGQARSAEAMVTGIDTITDDDATIVPTTIKGDTNVETPKPSPKPSASPTPPTSEKTETPGSAGSPVR